MKKRSFYNVYLQLLISRAEDQYETDELEQVVWEVNAISKEEAISKAKILESKTKRHFGHEGVVERGEWAPRAEIVEGKELSNLIAAKLKSYNIAGIVENDFPIEKTNCKIEENVYCVVDSEALDDYMKNLSKEEEDDDFSEIKGLYRLIYGCCNHQSLFISTRGKIKKCKDFVMNIDTSLNCEEEISFNDIELITENQEFIILFSKFKLESEVNPLDSVLWDEL